MEAAEFQIAAMQKLIDSLTSELEEKDLLFQKIKHNIDTDLQFEEESDDGYFSFFFFVYLFALFVCLFIFVLFCVCGCVSIAKSRNKKWNMQKIHQN